LQRLYIGNISFEATQEDVQAAFERFGTVHVSRGGGRLCGMGETMPNHVDLQQNKIRQYIRTIHAVQKAAAALAVTSWDDRCSTEPFA
jgi:RNA recognition motif-containing protein